MTREEAIGKWIYPAITTMWNAKKCNEILEALEQEPCEDAISRQAVEKITWEEPSYSDALNVLTEVRDKVRALPPVTPQPKTGHWILTIEDWNKWTCSECGFAKRTDIHVKLGYKFCPNCGAKMVGLQESGDKE